MDLKKVLGIKNSKFFVTALLVLGVCGAAYCSDDDTNYHPRYKTSAQGEIPLCQAKSVLVPPPQEDPLAEWRNWVLMVIGFVGVIYVSYHVIGVINSYLLNVNDVLKSVESKQSEIEQNSQTSWVCEVK